MLNPNNINNDIVLINVNAESHIYASVTIIGSDDGLTPGRYQAFV